MINTMINIGSGKNTKEKKEEESKGPPDAKKTIFMKI
jgi:hypothetical protein